MDLPFHKYTCLGNHFVVFDFSLSVQIPPLPDLARWAADQTCGVGADGVITVEPGRDGANTPVVRFFEPSGDEFLMCGNGLLCICLHFHLNRGGSEAHVHISSFSGRKLKVKLSYQYLHNTCEASLDYDPTDARHFVNGCTSLTNEGEPFDIQLDIPALGLPLHGFVTFTGEPHLIIFEAREWESWAGVSRERISSFGGSSAFLRMVGDYLNQHDRSFFPLGINVNLAVLHPHGRFEYRTYERGLFRETLACGTGAAAVAAVADHLLGVGEQRWIAYPQGALSHPVFKEHAQITVQGKCLSSRPRLVFRGTMETENDGSIFPVHG
jgi:diaminopimelate epimerase